LPSQLCSTLLSRSHSSPPLNCNRFVFRLRRSQVFFRCTRRTPISTLFPYTTLFRSECPRGARTGVARLGEAERPEHYAARRPGRSEEHTSELQSRENLVCRLLLEKK